MQDEPVVNPIPPLVIAFCLLVVGVELILTAAGAGIIGGPMGIGWRLGAVQDYGFSPLVLDRVVQFGDFDLGLLKRFVSYGFVHASFTTALFAAALLLALGKFVGDVYSPVAVLIVIIGSLVVGSIAFGIFVAGSAPLIGLFPAIYGLIGAYTYLIWLTLGATGENQLKAFQLIGFLLGLQLVFGLIFGSNSLWIAELAGFVFGFTVSIVVAPGGWTALLNKLRQRD